MRIPIVAGRPFDARDNAAAPPRVVVSQSLAERWFAGEQPIGRQIILGSGRMAEIIGVAGDVKHRALDDEGFWPTVYRSAWQAASGSMILVVRSQRPDADVVAAVREEVARLDRARTRRAIDAGCGRSLGRRARPARADRDVHGIRAAGDRTRRDWIVWCHGA